MRAVVFTDYETFPELERVDRPVPGPGEVLLKVAGAGACHSDVAIYRFPKGSPGALVPPFTPGHENSGSVEELGPGVSGVALMEQTAPLTSRKVDVPIVALGGQHAQGDHIREMIQMVATNVAGGPVPGCGHFIPEENPDELVRHILALLAMPTHRQYPAVSPQAELSPIAP